MAKLPLLSMEKISTRIVKVISRKDMSNHFGLLKWRTLVGCFNLFLHTRPETINISATHFGHRKEDFVPFKRLASIYRIATVEVFVQRTPPRFKVRLLVSAKVSVEYV